MPTTYIINDRSAEPRYAKTISPYTYTNQISQALVYSTQNSAESDCATLNTAYPPAPGGQNRFWVGAHP